MTDMPRPPQKAADLTRKISPKKKDMPLDEMKNEHHENLKQGHGSAIYGSPRDLDKLVEMRIRAWMLREEHEKKELREIEARHGREKKSGKPPEPRI